MSNDEQNGKLRNVAWSELFPWLILARVFRIAIQLRLMLLGAVGIFLTILGWTVLGWLFAGNTEVNAGNGGRSLHAVTSEIGNTPRLLQSSPAPEMVKLEPVVSPEQTNDAMNAVGPAPTMPKLPMAPRAEGLSLTASRPLWGTWEYLSQPFRNVFSSRSGPGAVAFSFLCGLWAVAVWAFFGGAISRAASIELATGDRAKLFRTLNFAASKWAAYFAAPLIPLVGALLIALPVAFAGLFIYWGGVCTVIAGIGWPLVLLAGFLMTLLLLGLVFGWPLFWGNLSTEGVDSFDAVGRTYDYVYHRPLNYLFYAVVAGVLGALGWLVVANFFEGIIGASCWAASWGGSDSQVSKVMSGAADLTTIESAGSWLIRFWVGCLKFLGIGFLYSYIWVAGSAMYLLLRRDVDATEMDEVLPEEEAEPQPAPLPEVKTDEAGAPVVADQAPSSEDASPQPGAPTDAPPPAAGEGEKPQP